MGAGIDPKLLRKRLYNALKHQQRDLLKAGIPTLYRKLQLYPDITGIDSSIDLGFNISYNVLRASNGETAAMRYVHVVHDGVTYGKDWDADKGIKRIKELWAGKSRHSRETPRFNYSRTCECGAPYDNDLKMFTCAD